MSISSAAEKVLGRVDRLVAERLRPAIHPERTALHVEAWEAPDEPVDFETAMAGRFTPVHAGDRWGRPWGTTWFRASGPLPEGLDADGGTAEILVDLGFTSDRPGFQAEALAYSASGRILKSVQPMNRHLPVTLDDAGDVLVLLEAASNPDFGTGEDVTPTPMGLKGTAGDAPLYVLGGVELVRRDLTVWELVQDIAVLRGLVDVLPEDRPRRARILQALERMADLVDRDRVAATAPAARDALAPVLTSPAVPSAHTVIATGHAHIDSAWLWPVRETVRKCARTFSNVLALIDEHPEFVFTCSSAQQYAWVEERYPDLFDRIRDAVRAGQFVPAGGMWVESDTNMPGGEALVRQFLEGKRYFLDRFGVDPEDVWLPDSFGYSGGLPQIALGAGARWFLTQKISWNDTNLMPHHTFWWEGIDGSRIFTHFPPADTYISDLSARDLDRAERQFSEKAVADHSLLPFGWGNGGGGPTREMLAAAARQRDLEGSPRVHLGSAADFFAAAERELPEAPVWSGELYLELHRGVLTSQARTKRGNRRNEHLLREAELWATSATVLARKPYPYDDLEQWWRTVLLLQFHDILPGSSIAWVHREAERLHEEVSAGLQTLIDASLDALTGPGDRVMMANPAPVSSGAVPAGAIALVDPDPDTGADGHVQPVEVDGNGFELSNELLRVRIDRAGVLTSVLHLATGREVIPDGHLGGRLQLFPDVPNRWDAWDVDAHDLRRPTDLTSPASVRIAATGRSVEVTHVVDGSTIRQRISLQSGAAAIDYEFDIDWHEKQKLLKLAFPLQVHADRYAAETQFGHIWRNAHRNTSWDSARFEVCAHRWILLAEPGFGVGVANDSTYGHDVTTVSTPSGRAGLLRLSLLRAPLFPDPDADQGAHRMRCTLLVGADVPAMVAEGYRLNQPMRRRRGGRPVPPLFAADPGAVVLETVKPAADRSGDLILRLYESTGGAASTTVRSAIDISSVTVTDLLERPAPDATALVIVDGSTIGLRLRPFQLVTLRIRPAPTTATRS